MGRVIIKPNQDVDFYVEWSTVIDAPLAWGSRSEFLEEAPRSPDFPYTAERFERADRNSSSWQSHFDSWAKDKEMLFEGRGWIKRSQLQLLCESLNDDGTPTEATLALLEPLDL